MEKEKDFSFSTYIVRSQKVCGWLQQHKFILQGMEKNKDNPNWNVFFFNNTPELRECIEEYRNLSKNK